MILRFVCETETEATPIGAGGLDAAKARIESGRVVFDTPIGKLSFPLDDAPRPLIIVSPPVPD